MGGGLLQQGFPALCLTGTGLSLGLLRGRDPARDKLPRHHVAVALGQLGGMLCKQVAAARTKIVFFHCLTNMIPLTLYQTDKTVPSEQHVTEWKRLNPGLTYVFHTNTDAEAYLLQAWGPEHRDAFRVIVPGAIKADFLRLCYIADRGGFYCDTDNAPGDLRALTPHSLVVCQSMHSRQLFNAFFGARPGHPALAQLVDRALDNIRQRRYWYGGHMITAIAGPRLMGELVDEPDSVVLLERPRGSVVTPAGGKIVEKWKDNSWAAGDWRLAAYTGVVYHDRVWQSPRGIALAVAATLLIAGVIGCLARRAARRRQQSQKNSLGVRPQAVDTASI